MTNNENIKIQLIPNTNYNTADESINLIDVEKQNNFNGWVKQSGTSVVTNDHLAPDGTLTADKVTGNGSNGIYYVIGTSGLIARSIYVKSVSGTQTIKLKDPQRTIQTLNFTIGEEWQLITLSEDNKIGNSGVWLDDISSTGVYLWGAKMIEVSPSTTSAIINKPTITNYVNYSNDFSLWNNIGDVTVTNAPTINSPDGGKNTFKLTADTTSGLKLLAFPITAGTATNGDTVTVSCFVKSAGSQYIKMYLNDTTSRILTVDIDNKSVYSASSSISNIKIQDFGNGWLRISFSHLLTANLSTVFLSPSLNGGSVSFTGNGVDGVYVYGAQVEKGNILNDLVKTTGFPVTQKGKDNIIATNYVNYSEDFSNPNWFKSNVNLVSTNTISPVNSNFYNFIPNNNSSHWMQILTTQPFTPILSIIVKKTSAIDEITLYPGGAGTFANFNLTNLTHKGETNVDYTKIVDLGDGIYQLIAGYATSYDRFRIYASDGVIGASVTNANGVDGILITGAQVKENESSYIATNGFPVTQKGIDNIIVNDGYLDLTSDTNFPLNFSVSEIRDISKRKGTFSKSIKLAGTKNNNKLLNNYYDINITEGTFDINKLTKCIVTVNDVPILDNAYLQLISIDKKQNTSNEEESIVYTILLKDSISDFYTIINNRYLEEIEFSTPTHFYNRDAVVASWSHTVDDVYKYVMPASPSSNIYQLNQFNIGIYAKQYFDKIFENAGYSYNWDSLTDNDIRFDKLIIPFNGDSSKAVDNNLEKYSTIIKSDDDNQYTFTFFKPFDDPNTLNTTPLSDDLVLDTEVSDPSNLLNTTDYSFNAPFYFFNNNFLELEITYEFEAIYTNQQEFPVQFQDSPNLRLLFTPLTNGNDDNGSTPSLYTSNNVNGTILNNGEAISFGTVSGVSYIDITNVDKGDDITLASILNSDINMVLLDDNGNLYLDDANGQALSAPDIDVKVVMKNLQVKYKPKLNSLTFGQPVNINSFIPQKIKQSEFLKSFVMLYNLYLEVNKENPNNIIIKKRDDYYDSGITVDWTDKLNKDKTQTIKFLPELTAKKLKLTYKQDDKDELLETYLSATNEIYGQFEYTYDNEYVKGVDKKEIIFSPTFISTTSFGAITPAIKGNNPSNNIRLLFDGGMLNSGEFFIQDFFSNTVSNGLNQYPYFGHFDNPSTPSFDLNFGTCDYYPLNNLDVTNNTMYNLHWRRTVNQINKNKLLTCYLNLNEIDINKLKLNHKIRLNNAYYNINSIIDYNPSTSAPTKVELLTIGDELNLGRLGSRITRPFNDSLYNFDTLNNLGVDDLYLGDVNGNGNVIHSNGDVKGNHNKLENGAGWSFVQGDNNSVKANSKNSIIVGNGNEINAKNVLIVGDNKNVYKDNSAFIENLDVGAITVNGEPIKEYNINVTSVNRSVTLESDINTVFGDLDIESGNVSTTLPTGINGNSIKIRRIDNTNLTWAILPTEGDYININSVVSSFTVAKNEFLTLQFWGGVWYKVG